MVLRALADVTNTYHATPSTFSQKKTDGYNWDITAFEPKKNTQYQPAKVIDYALDVFGAVKNLNQKKIDAYEAVKFAAKQADEEDVEFSDLDSEFDIEEIDSDDEIDCRNDVSDAEESENSSLEDDDDRDEPSCTRIVSYRAPIKEAATERFIPTAFKNFVRH